MFWTLLKEHDNRKYTLMKEHDQQQKPEWKHVIKN